MFITLHCTCIRLHIITHILYQLERSKSAQCKTDESPYKLKSNFFQSWGIVKAHFHSGKFFAERKFCKTWLADTNFPWEKFFENFQWVFPSMSIFGTFSVRGNFSWAEMGLKSWKFSTSKFFSDGKFVSANHILQNFLSAKNFPEWKWPTNNDT
jgi:hypothetical protein